MKTKLLNLGSEAGWSAMQRIASQVVRGILMAVGFIAPTVLFFGLPLGFHHIYAIGILGPIVLNAETPPQAGDYVWGDFAVRFFPVRFLVSLAFWYLAIMVAFG